jgi:putative transposase
MAYDPQRHHRRTIRLKGYDYTAPGAYYVTIIVRNRERMLSRIVDGQVILAHAGVLAEAAWRRLPDHFSRVILDTFVIMPDHIHGIVVLQGESEHRNKPRADRPAGTRPGSLAAVVQNFKSVAARRINQADGTPGRCVWQEDYYEHIVRDEADMERIRRYIRANPSRWRP